MTGLKVWTSGGAEAATARLATSMRAVIYRSILQGAFLLGRKVVEKVEAFKQTPGTKRLSRSFLVPVGDGLNFILGRNSPVYAAIHEYGGTIKPKHAEYLVFQTPDGAWHAVKEVTIREKRYARDAIEAFSREDTMTTLLAANMTAAYKAT
jgi:phage gpG-like protein